MPTVPELREMDEEELLGALAEAKQELFNLRFQHVTGQLDNYARLGQVRKDIARMNTILREREIDAAEAEERAAAKERAAAAERATAEERADA
jgi:large subunit ribosomal protein L29